jgi:gas vesicle protein
VTNGYFRYAGFFVAGALIGGAAAALSTPYDGRRMRRIVKRRVEEGSDKVLEAAEQFREGCDDMFVRGQKVMRSAEKLFAKS